MSKIIIWLFTLTFLTGCKYTCLKNHINPVFIGFSITDIDTLVFRAYKPNDNYQHLMDTIMIHNLFATIYTTSNDTTVVYLNSSNPDEWISNGFDWQIHIPAKNRTVLISNIISPKTEGSNKGCRDPIESFVQDGQPIHPKLVNTGNFSTSGYMAYIRN